MGLFFGTPTDVRLTGYYTAGFESACMSRRHRRSGPPGSGTGASRLGGIEAVERASVVGSAPIIAGTGFVLSRAVAIVLAGASGLTFLWGLVIGLAFATAGVVVFASTETESRPGRPARRMERVPLTTAGGVLLLSLLTGVVLGTVL
jgi:purine-cytosine permease-like protein